MIVSKGRISNILAPTPSITEYIGLIVEEHADFAALLMSLRKKAGSDAGTGYPLGSGHDSKDIQTAVYGQAP